MAKKYICIILALLILVVGTTSAAEYNQVIENKGFSLALERLNSLSFSYDHYASAIGVAIYEQELRHNNLMEKQNQMMYIQTCGTRPIMDHYSIGINNTQVTNWCEKNKDILDGY